MDDHHKRMHKAIKLLLAHLLKDKAELLPIDSKNKTIIRTSIETEKTGDMETIPQDELPADSHCLS